MWLDQPQRTIPLGVGALILGAALIVGGIAALSVFFPF